MIKYLKSVYWAALVPCLACAGTIESDGEAVAAAGEAETAAASAALSTQSKRWNDFFCVGDEVCLTGDMNGDGLADAVAIDQVNHRTWVGLSDGTRFLAGSDWGDSGCNLGQTCRIGDVNGDGSDDIVTFTVNTNPRNTARLNLSTGSGLQGWFQAGTFICLNGETCLLGDVTGDGRADAVVFTKNATGDVWIAVGGASGFGTRVKMLDNFCYPGEVCALGNVNGDIYDDFITFVRSSASGSAAGDVYVSLIESGRPKPGVKVADWFCVGNEDCQVADMDGDGHADLVAFTKGSSADVWVATFTPSGYFNTASKWHDFFCAGNETCRVADVDGVPNSFGRGSADLVTFVRSTGSGSAVGDVYVSPSR